MNSCDYYRPFKSVFLLKLHIVAEVLQTSNKVIQILKQLPYILLQWSRTID